MNETIYKRIARVEAMANAQKAELEETWLAAYESACKAQDEAEASTLARKIRDKRLADSDSRMTLDRLGLDFSSASKLFASLSKITASAWAQYRQQLRDLPEQAGFPFNVCFPDAPDAQKKEDEEWTL